MTKDEIKQHQEVAKGFQQNIKKLKNRVNTAQAEFIAWQLDKVAVASGADKDDIEIGSWDCKTSPIGVCAYGEDGDDFCLFCGGPDERK